MFHVGQKVVCVDVSDIRTVGGEERPLVGKTYTIREICSEGQRGPAYLLHEIWNPRMFYRFPDGSVRWSEYYFGHWRFRPLTERKTDISIFTAMLNPAPSKVTERVR